MGFLLLWHAVCWLESLLTPARACGDSNRIRPRTQGWWNWRLVELALLRALVALDEKIRSWI